MIGQEVRLFVAIETDVARNPNQVNPDGANKQAVKETPGIMERAGEQDGGARTQLGEQRERVRVNADVGEWTGVADGPFQHNVESIELSSKGGTVLASRACDVTMCVTEVAVDGGPDPPCPPFPRAEPSVQASAEGSLRVTRWAVAASRRMGAGRLREQLVARDMSIVRLLRVV